MKSTKEIGNAIHDLRGNNTKGWQYKLDDTHELLLEILLHIDALSEQAHEPQPVITVREFQVLHEQLSRVTNMIHDVAEMTPSRPVMTLRDHFAGLALQIVGRDRWANQEQTVAANAYLLADAMLVTRESYKAEQPQPPAPDAPCICGARFNEPVHDPKYGGHAYEKSDS